MTNLTNAAAAAKTACGQRFTAANADASTDRSTKAAGERFVLSASKKR